MTPDNYEHDFKPIPPEYAHSLLVAVIEYGNERCCFYLRGNLARAWEDAFCPKWGGAYKHTFHFQFTIDGLFNRLH